MVVAWRSDTLGIQDGKNGKIPGAGKVSVWSRETQSALVIAFKGVIKL